MAGLVPAIHGSTRSVLCDGTTGQRGCGESIGLHRALRARLWMAGTSPAMTTETVERSSFHASPTGANLGKAMSGVIGSKRTATGMSQRTSSGAMPTMLLMMRGPSSSSTSPTT
jgi:hypothetical protein